ncbi:hypothetical protein [Streptomyces sp. I05A-00742]|nr:hypothetical protein [Streptomyces sp. I05A-00742]
MLREDGEVAAPEPDPRVDVVEEGGTLVTGGHIRVVRVGLRAGRSASR